MSNNAGVGSRRRRSYFIHRPKFVLTSSMLLAALLCFRMTVFDKSKVQPNINIHHDHNHNANRHVHDNDCNANNDNNQQQQHKEEKVKDKLCNVFVKTNDENNDDKRNIARETLAAASASRRSACAMNDSDNEQRELFKDAMNKSDNEQRELSDNEQRELFKDVMKNSDNEQHERPKDSDNEQHERPKASKINFTSNVTGSSEEDAEKDVIVCSPPVHEDKDDNEKKREDIVAKKSLDVGITLDKVDKTLEFPEQLMKLLSENKFEEIISWLPHGNSFIACDKKKFTETILPTYFKGTKYESFTRKLNRWGFTQTK